MIVEGNKPSMTPSCDRVHCKRGVSDGKNFQPSTICEGGFGTKIMFFTYGFTTFIGKTFIDSCSAEGSVLVLGCFLSPDKVVFAAI